MDPKSNNHKCKNYLQKADGQFTYLKYPTWKHSLYLLELLTGSNNEFYFTQHPYPFSDCLHSIIKDLFRLSLLPGRINSNGKIDRKTYRSRTRKPNALLKRCFCAHFFPSQIAPEFGFLVMKHKKRKMLGCMEKNSCRNWCSRFKLKGQF